MSRSRHRNIQWKHKRRELPDWKVGCPSSNCQYCAENRQFNTKKRKQEEKVAFTIADAPKDLKDRLAARLANLTKDGVV